MYTPFPHIPGVDAAVSIAPIASRTTPSDNTVLVVDDELVTRKVLGHLLETAGMSVEYAENGMEALTIISSKEIDLVLLDFQMPKLDGLKTIRLLRQLYSHVELPVIMMTANSGRCQIIDALQNGANDYIAKPIDRQISLARVNLQLTLGNAQKNLRASEERYALAAKGTNDGMWDWNLLNSDLYLSPRWKSMLGIESSAWNPIGSQWMELIHPEDIKRVTADLESHLCGESQHFESELRMRQADESYRWMLIRGLAVRDEVGMACRIAGSLTDITEGKVADGLTGLPNRTLFYDRVKRRFEQYTKNASKKFAVMYLDVDDFKLINDSLGHDAGDAFLISMAERLNSAIRAKEALVARLGGDEFGVLVDNIRSADDAVTVAMRLHSEMNVPFKICDREILTRASIGIALPTKGCESFDELLRQADTAMYQAKKQSVTPYAVFNQQMMDEKSSRLEMGGELRHAIERDELTVFYQPIVDVKSRSVVCVEALCRWHHPVHGNISPVQFIPIAEANGLIIEIGEWVLRKSCEVAMRWNQATGRQLIICVNVSIRQLVAKGFVGTVKRVIQETGLAPHCLKLEVTESLLMQCPEQTIEILSEIRETGVTIGIDDFGTGYSSLSYLHTMPLDTLKVDRSFVMDISDFKHKAIVKSIVALASSLDMKVVAEGVETEEQLLELESLGCDMAQGYLFSRPVPELEAEALLNERW